MVEDYEVQGCSCMVRGQVPGHKAARICGSSLSLISYVIITVKPCAYELSAHNNVINVFSGLAEKFCDVAPKFKCKSEHVQGQNSRYSRLMPETVCSRH
jgi:hypothetical protein